MVNPLQTPDPLKALVLTLLLVGGFVVPLGAGPAWADSHGAMQNALGEGPYFLHDAPRVEGEIGMGLMIPWFQPTTPVTDSIENLGYDRVRLQIPEGRAVDPIINTVQGVSLCPFPSGTLEPLASTACLPIAEDCDMGSTLSYCTLEADAEAEHEIEIVLDPGLLDGLQGGLRLDLAFLGDPSGGSHTIKIGLDGDHWSAEPVNGEATYETAPDPPTLSLRANLAGNWTLKPPLLNETAIQVYTEAGEDPIAESAYGGPVNGTWALIFVPLQDGEPGTLNYTIQALIDDAVLELHPPVVAGVGNLDTWLMSPATWVFNAHTGQSVACAPALPGVCDDADPLRIQDARFFLNEA